MAFEATFSFPDPDNYRDLTGMSSEELADNFSELREEKARGSYFRAPSSRWHVDGWPVERITTFSSSTPTEVASCSIEFLPYQSGHDKHGRVIEATYILPKMFGKHWLEKAGGIVDVDEEEARRIRKVIRVSDLAIMQLMPMIAVTADIKTFLHRSAVVDPSSPRVRLFGRNYD